MVTQLATAKAGLILVNINPAYRIHELEYALNKVGCRALVIATASRPATISAMLRRAGAELARRAPGGCAPRGCPI